MAAETADVQLTFHLALIYYRTGTKRQNRGVWAPLTGASMVSLPARLPYLATVCAFLLLFSHFFNVSFLFLFFPPLLPSPGL